MSDYSPNKYRIAVLKTGPTLAHYSHNPLVELIKMVIKNEKYQYYLIFLYNSKKNFGPDFSKKPNQHRKSSYLRI